MKSISTIAGSPASGVLFESSANGLSLVLREGSRSRLSWELVVEDRVLLVELWFNRTFSRRGQLAGGSWSRSMRPDVSLRVRPRTGRPSGLNDPELDVWLHFDAKYRIEAIEVDAPVDGDTPEDPSIAAKREDLLKMHATEMRSAAARARASCTPAPAPQSSGPSSTSCCRGSEPSHCDRRATEVWMEPRNWSASSPWSSLMLPIKHPQWSGHSTGRQSRIADQDAEPGLLTSLPNHPPIPKC